MDIIQILEIVLRVLAFNFACMCTAFTLAFGPIWLFEQSVAAHHDSKQNEDRRHGITPPIFHLR